VVHPFLRRRRQPDDTNILDGIGTTVYTYTAGGQLLTEDGPFASYTVMNTYVKHDRPCPEGTYH
jgi:hypothetical protein